MAVRHVRSAVAAAAGAVGAGGAGGASRSLHRSPSRSRLRLDELAEVVDLAVEGGHPLTAVADEGLQGLMAMHVKQVVRDRPAMLRASQVSDRVGGIGTARSQPLRSVLEGGRVDRKGGHKKGAALDGWEEEEARHQEQNDEAHRDERAGRHRHDVAGAVDSRMAGPFQGRGRSRNLAARRVVATADSR